MTTVTLLVVWLLGQPIAPERVRAFVAPTWTQCEAARKELDHNEFGSVCVQVPLEPSK